MATTIVHYTPAQNVTAKADSDLKAGTFVEIAGDVDGRNPVVKTATANATAFGVPAKDTKKGSHVMVYRSGHIVEVAAQGAIKEGSAVKVAASGKASTTGDGPTAGIAVSAAEGGVVQVALA
ncbi:capsid cement protein [Corynebacterium cystitidis]|uniref:capsid cement protein n=1 Tax=Corynebacterium cystitidis TaxID=35757 RepID=UPI00211F2271|nr:capsid cement protein [Corynebacterium cystitidis]